VDPPALPATEAERLAALRVYGDADEIVDDSLDALVRVAASVCDVPIALVSLVGETSQRFVARVGLDAAMTRTSREVSFCGHALLRPDEIMIVPDAFRDRRFADNPLVTGDPNIRFYAGAPLVDDTGAACDRSRRGCRAPRLLSPSQLATLRDLSSVATKVLAMRRAARALEAAAEAEAATRSHLQIVIETAPNMIAYWNADLTNRFSNASYRRFFRLEASIEGRHIRYVLGEERYRENLPKLQAALAGTPQRFTRSYERDGKTEIVIGDYSPDVRDGKVNGIVATLRDVTEELSQRAELLALSEQVADVGHWRLGVQDRAVFWSPQIYRVLGLDPATYVPDYARAIECYHPDDRAQVAQVLEEAMRRGDGFDYEARIVRPTGEIRRIHARGRCERRTAGAAESMFGVFQDVTEREELRERLARQEKLATVGTLAAGVGHEINNPLTLISANLDHALEEIEQGRAHELSGVLQEVRDGAERIRKIVRGLRAFARDDVVAVPTDVEAAVGVATQMALHELRSRATLEVVSGGPPLVLADEGQLSQILLNLLVNASQAFTSHDPTRNKVIVRTERTTQGQVAIEVEDNGTGIAPEVLARIFDPFFTTKPVGQGTGLGLSISQSIASSLGGELTCTSQLGNGTTFRLTLPVAEPSPPPPASSVRLPPPESSRGRVLIIDDEVPILRIFGRLLGGEHDVTTFSDPRAAEKVLRERDASFDVVFCDLMMPHLTGMDLHRAVAAVNPELATRFVFTSGGVAVADAERFLREVPNERIEKPFRAEDVRAIARRFTLQRAARPG
jgi:PAS domain S-box-containing protein